MQLEATHLFETGSSVHLDIDHRMYSIKAHAPENWVWHAFKGFDLIKFQFENAGFTPKTFAAIGSGSGVDAIGASRIFTGLERIVVTDVENDVVRQAAENVRKNVSDDIEVIGLSGNVCVPLAEQGIQADVIYANLPNIPLSGTENLDYGTFYRVDQDKVDSGAQGEAAINRYLLGLQYKYLESVKPALSEDGVATFMIGGRFPLEVLDELARASGFQYDELLAGFKLQTEAVNVTEGYAGWEVDGTEFDFYDYDQALQMIDTDAIYRGDELKSRLHGARVDARTARILVGGGRRVGHTLHMMCGRPGATS